MHTCALLAGEAQVIVAGDVVPLAVLVPDHHHAVFPRLEEAIWLVGPPVFVLLQGISTHTHRDMFTTKTHTGAQLLYAT